MSKYKWIIAEDEYPGRRYSNGQSLEHRVVWWRNTGIVPGDGFVIHHKDGNKSNNAFENLEMMECSKHSSHHHKVHDDFVELTCFFCGKKFMRSGRNAYYKESIGMRQCCSRKCKINFVKREKTDVEINMIKSLREKGMSSYKISEVTGFSRNTIMKYW